MTSRTGTGEEYNRKWGIGAKQARYHKDGHFYGLLERFPAALCDPQGYVLFQTKEEYQRLDPDYLGLGEKKMQRPRPGRWNLRHSRLYQSRKMKLEF